MATSAENIEFGSLLVGLEESSSLEPNIRTRSRFVPTKAKADPWPRKLGNVPIPRKDKHEIETVVVCTSSFGILTAARQLDGVCSTFTPLIEEMTAAAHMFIDLADPCFEDDVDRSRAEMAQTSAYQVALQLDAVFAAAADLATFRLQRTQKTGSGSRKLVSNWQRIIHAAKLARVPEVVIDRTKRRLEELYGATTTEPTHSPSPSAKKGRKTNTLNTITCQINQCGLIVSKANYQRHVRVAHPSLQCSVCARRVHTRRKLDSDEQEAEQEEEEEEEADEEQEEQEEEEQEEEEATIKEEP